MSINVVFESLTSEEKHLIIKEGKQPDPIQNMLFGEGMNDYAFFELKSAANRTFFDSFCFLAPF